MSYSSINPLEIRIFEIESGVSLSLPTQLGYPGTWSPDGETLHIVDIDQENDSFDQLSARIRLDLFNRPGSGWTLKLDGRNQLNLNRDKSNRVILYDASLTYDRSGSPLYFSAGQLNLYDTGGIGQLLGGVIGYKPSKFFLVGGYAGFESNVYIKYMESDYWRFGFFGQYQGKLGKRLSLSFNQLRYSGVSEKKYLYFSGMIPIKKYLVLYGNTEYQFGQDVDSQDRLSRLFFNLRFDSAASFPS